MNVRQLNLLDDKESVRPFDSHNDESERAITTFIFLRILISLLALVSSLSSLAGTLLDKMLLIVPFIIVLIVGTLGWLLDNHFIGDSKKYVFVPAWKRSEVTPTRTRGREVPQVYTNPGAAFSQTQIDFVTYWSVSSTSKVAE